MLIRLLNVFCSVFFFFNGCKYARPTGKNVYFSVSHSISVCFFCHRSWNSAWITNESAWRPLVVRTSHWFSCGPSGGWVHRSLSFSSTCEQRFTWWNNWENRITITLTTNTESKLHLHALYKAIFPGGFILIRSLMSVTSTPYFETWMAGRLVTCLSPWQSGIRLPCVGRLHLRR